MTDQEIKDLIATYSLRGMSSRRSDGSPVYLAWYDELPGCIAEAIDRDHALPELDAIAYEVVRLASAEGQALPPALSSRGGHVATNTMRLTGILVGGATVAEASPTNLTNRPRFIERTLASA